MILKNLSLNTFNQFKTKHEKTQQSDRKRSTDLPSRPAVRRLVSASLCDVWVFFLQSFHCHLGTELYQQAPHWSQKEGAMREELQNGKDIKEIYGGKEEEIEINEPRKNCNWGHKGKTELLAWKRCCTCSMGLWAATIYTLKMHFSKCITKLDT